MKTLNQVCAELENTHGGAGRGAGRKPKSGTKKVRMTVFVTPETAEYLKSQSVPLGEAIDMMREELTSA